MINMDILENGNKIKKMGKDSIYIPTERNMRVVGLKIKKKEEEYINIEMETSMMEIGKMIGDKEREQ
jgi:hypothetical protein